MSGTNGTSCKKGISTLVRPRFEAGMLLQHDDLEQMSAYTRDLNRLMFRSLFGCGVVCGLVVTPKRDCGKDSVTIGAGLALDCNGDPIYVPTDQDVTIDEHCDPYPMTKWVTLCHWSKCCAPRTAMCASDEEETSSVCTRERDGYKICIVSTLPDCACHCDAPRATNADTAPKDTTGGYGATTNTTTRDDTCLCVDATLPCYKHHYAGICGCSCDDCAGGSCDCVVLAKLTPPKVGQNLWTADHSVRRFVRPVLMRDPQIAIDKKNNAPPKAMASQKAPPQAQLKKARNVKVRTVLPIEQRKSE